MDTWGAAAIVFLTEARELDARLTQRFAAAGRTRWLKPAPRAPERWDPMLHGDGEASPTWGAAIVPAPGVCLVVTAPPLLLLEEAAPSEVRLQALARALGRPCAFLRLAEACLSLVEVKADGTMTASGLGDPKRPLAVGDVSLSPAAPRARFTALTVPDAVNEALERGSPEDQFAAALEVLVPRCPPLELLRRSLLGFRRIPLRGARTLYFRRRPEVTAAPGSALDVQLEPLEVALGKGLALSAGGGRAELVNESLCAARPEEGAPLLAALAEWLEQPAPPTPEHGVTEPAFTLLAPLPDAPRRVGVTTELLTLGDRKPVSLVLHRAQRGPSAQLEERDVTQRKRLIETLAPALVGRHGRPAPVPRLERVALPWTVQVNAVATTGGFVAACWKKTTTALYAVRPGEPPRELGEVPGVVTGLASLGARFALTVADPVLTAAGWPGVRPDCASRLLVGTNAIFEGRFGFTPLVGSPDGTQVALAIEGLAHTRQTLVLDAGSGEELFRSAELVNAESAAWDAEGLLLRGHDRRTFADRWFRWPLPGEPRLTQELFTAGDGRAVSPNALRGAWLPPGPLVRSGDRLAVVAGDDGERAALFDAGRGTVTELFPVDGFALAAFGEGGYVAATQGDRRLYLGALNDTRSP